MTCPCNCFLNIDHKQVTKVQYFSLSDSTLAAVTTLGHGRAFDKNNVAMRSWKVARFSEKVAKLSSVV